MKFFTMTLFALAVHGQVVLEVSPQEAALRLKTYLNLMQSMDSAWVLDEYADYCAMEMREANCDSLFEDTLRSFAVRYLAYGKTAQVRNASFGILTGLPETAQTDSLFRSLIQTNDLMKESAAAYLIERGEWDIAAPVLAEKKDFGRMGNDPRLKPYLYSALQDSALYMRAYAAFLLARRFGDGTYLLTHVRAHLQATLNEPWSHARSHSLQLLSEHDSVTTRDVKMIADMALQEPEMSMRSDSWRALRDLAKRRAPGAIDLLPTIEANAPDDWMRARASELRSELSTK